MSRFVAVLLGLALISLTATLDGVGSVGRIGRRTRHRKRYRASLTGAQVLVDERVGGVADTLGDYKVRSVRSGWHRVAARLIGYRGVVLDSVFISRRSRGDRGLRPGAESARAGAPGGQRAL